MTHARIWHGATALAAWAALALQIVLSTMGVPGDGLWWGYRLFRFFCYFTIWSNIVVAIVATMLWRDPARNGRIFRVVRLDSLLMITITGLVYAIVLAPLYSVTGIRMVADWGLHYVVPTLTVVSFLVVGPRMRFTAREVFGALVIPVIWIAFTLINGAIRGFYPYPFIDVGDLGYARVAMNIAGICVIGILFGFAYLGIDRLLLRRPIGVLATGVSASKPAA